jgi:RNA polymerase sigma-70 factor (ECF subfamily)
MPSSRNPKKIRDEDFNLIEAINSGRQDLFSELVSRYERRLYNFGLRMCGDAQDAEDLIQDTFLNVFRYLKKFRFETKFKNWLYRVAASACIKKRVRSKFAPEKDLAMEDLVPGGENEVPDQLPDWASQPLDQLLNEELSGYLMEAVRKLPSRYRLVIILRDLEGFSTQETAQILKISESNVKVRLHRGRLFLREQLKDYFKHG